MSHQPHSSQPSQGQPPDVVLIGGPPRSGTSLTHMLLDGHPQVHCARTDWVAFDRYHTLAAMSGIETPRSHDDLRRIFDVALAGTPLAKWRLDRDLVDAELERHEPSWDAVFLTMIQALRAQHPGKTIALKRPTAEEHAPRITALLARHGLSCRFVYCLRAPYDTFLSWKHRRGAWGEGDGLETNVKLWIALWLTSTARALELRHGTPEATMLVRYEDVVADPHGESSRLCRFLDLPDEAGTMVTLQDAEPPNSSFDDHDRGARTGGVVALPSHERPQPSPREATLIDTRCARRAHAFGYDLGVPPGAPERALDTLSGLPLVPTRQLLREVRTLVTRRMRDRVRRSDD